MIRVDEMRPALGLIALLAAAVWLYAPGLTGPFLFDDYPNLDGLAAINRDGTWYSVLQYALGGASGANGRPLSLLTFAAQAPSWNGHPADFIRANVLLHVLNGALWYRVVLQLQRLHALPPGPSLPLLACAMWLLLPIHAGAVLYVVQRMAELATTFTLAGIALYLAGRRGAGAGRFAGGFTLMSAGVLVAVLTGTLSKETAAVTPLLLLALEGTLLRAVARPPHWRLWSGAFLWLPAMVLAAYFALRLPAFLDGYAVRTFTPGERLLTESRVLFVYLVRAFVPSGGIRLLYDDFTLSTSLFAPWTTLPAIVAWIAIVAVAVLKRRDWPLFSFAVAWYLIGHLLESTIIPLEIAFDHRNYLPLLGPTLGLAAGAVHVAGRGQRMRVIATLAAAAYLGLLAVSLRLSASLWGRPLEQAREWAMRQPESMRAVHHYGSLLLYRQDLSGALQVFAATHRRRPDDAVIALAYFELGCFHPGIQPSLPDVERAIREHRGGELPRAVLMLQRMADRVASGQCPHQAPDEILSLIDAMLLSPRFGVYRLALCHAAAMLLDGTGRKEQALRRLEQALEVDAQVPLLQQAVLWSVQLGEVARARSHLATLESSPRIDARERWIYREEIRGTRQLIELYESLPGRAAPVGPAS